MEHPPFRPSAPSPPIGDGIITCDLKSRVMHLNAAAEIITGWPAPEAAGRPLEQICRLLDAVSQTPIADPVARVGQAADGVALPGDVCLQDRKGVIRHIAGSAVPVPDDSDQITRVLLIIRDITAIWNDYAQLKEERYFIEQILEATRTGFNVTDANYNLRQVNLGWQKIYGDPTGRKCHEYFKGCRRPCSECGIPIALARRQKIVREDVLPLEDNRVVEVHTIPLQSASGEWVVAEFKVDITARKRIEEELNQRKKELESIFSSATTVSLVKTSLTGMIEEFSAGAEHIFGYAREEVIGQHVGLLHSAEETARLASYVERLVTEGKGFTIEARLVKKSGAHFWALFSPQPVFNSTGDVVGTLGVTIDISDRKTAEEALRQSEKRFELAIDGAGVGLWDWDMVHQTVYLSPQWKAMLGYTDDELENSFESWRQLWHPDDALRIQASMAAHLAGTSPKYEIEHRLRAKDGSWRRILTRGELLTDNQGKPIRWVGTNIDLTDFRQMEEALLRSQQHLASVVQTQQEMICRFLPDTTLTFVNEAYCRFFNAPVQELVGKQFLDFIPATEHDGIRQKISRLNAANPTLNYEHPVRLTDGTEVWQEWTDQVILDSRGQVLELQSVGRDITTRKKAEQQLLIAKEEAEAANRAKSDFLANMSHEIRTPLNAVIGLSQHLMDTPLNDEQQDSLFKIRTSSRILLQIINDILDYSKIEAGRLELEIRPFRLNDLLDQMKTLFTALAHEKGLTLLWIIEPNVPRALMGDALRLGQVLTNLLSNALKFTEQGQVTLRISRKAGTKDPVRLRFEIQDTGIGLDGSQIARLFQPFTQADNSTTRKYGGTGLGLVIARSLVVRMGGFLELISTPGQGSTFFFELNMAVVAPDQHPMTDLNDLPKTAFRPDFTPTAPLSLNGFSILLVEDNALNQEVAHRYLLKTGAQVHMAANGAEAVELAMQQPFDLILMDLQMPVMDGFEATRQIRQHRPEIPIVALSAAVMENDRQRTRDAGMKAHLAKPIERDRLYQVLQDVLLAEPSPAHPAPAGVRRTGPSKAADSAPAHLPTGLHVPLEGFDLVRGLRAADGDEAFYFKLLHRFKDQLTNEFADLGQRLADAATFRQPESDTLRRQVHTLKGLAAMVGAIRLATIATTIDQVLSAKALITPDLHQELARALADAQSQLATLPPPTLPAATVDLAVGESAIIALLNILKTSELASDELLDAVLSFLQHRFDTQTAADFEKLVDSFDYAAAEATLRKLAESAGLKAGRL